MNVVSNKCGLKWMWSQLDVVSKECGLKWMWSQRSRSQMNVVSNKKVSCECGLKETGFKCRGLKWTWSRMSWFQLSAHPSKQYKVKVPKCYCNSQQWHEVRPQNIKKTFQFVSVKFRFHFTVTNWKNGQFFPNWPWNDQSGNPARNHIHCSLQFLLVYYVTRWSVYKIS